MTVAKELQAAEAAEHPPQRPTVLALIGMGANLGDTSAALRRALDALRKLPHSQVMAVSSLYSSAPIDSSGPDYANAVVTMHTQLNAMALLAELQRIELQEGRERPYRNAPRTLDLDLLLYGQASIASPTLSVPHPRITERAFVMLPLAEVAPDLVTSSALQAVADQSIRKIAPLDQGGAV